MIHTISLVLALSYLAHGSGVGHHHLAAIGLPLRAPLLAPSIAAAPLISPASEIAGVHRIVPGPGIGTVPGIVQSPGIAAVPRIVPGPGIVSTPGIAAVPRIVQSPGIAPASFVAAHSSQYFERTFNRLVAAPIVPQPVIPVAPAPPVVQPSPPVFVEPVTRNVPLPVTPQNVPVQRPLDPNVAIAIATAHAANPVATILLPPYPFAPPPNYGFVHPIVVPDIQQNGSTLKPSTIPTTTVREPEPTTPLPSPSNTDNSFAQLPTNQNPNIQQVYGPPELPRPFQKPQQNPNIQQVYGPPELPRPFPKPQKFKTAVEVVPQHLNYISPPPPHHNHHHHHHHHHGHPVKYVHSYVPAKLILRPVHVHTVKVPTKLVVHKVPSRNVQNNRQVLKSRADTGRDVEPTTFKPFSPGTKPPKL